ncbi:LysR family transcriptional regulator [Ramlibacter sp. G-1-2-2]|uniref:LysR family transcriptional regulator n=1 Tax=Ramlibacter agri TaxID=2728837 RepID=A0A848HAM0_9BURK|nr:LysR family transcriptional regulator [Ramlibacter agri]
MAASAPKLDLNLLPVVIALSEHRTVSAAARHLGMSQPAVSSALARLRASLGDPLFVRTARGMEATPRALAMLAPARAALGIVDHEILASQGFDPSTSERKITLALSDIGEMVFLPKILASLQTKAPGMTVRCVTLPVSQLERGLELGEIDLAVGYFPDLKGNNFFQQRLFSHGFVCLLRTGHPIKAPKLTAKQFMSLGHAVVNAEGRSQEVFERYLQKQGIRRRVVLNTPHFMSLPTIISASDLVATVPLAIGVWFASTARVRMAKPPYPVPKFDLKQHWHRRVNNDAQSRWLRELVYSLFNEEVDEWKAHAS